MFNVGSFVVSDFETTTIRDCSDVQCNLEEVLAARYRINTTIAARKVT